MESIQHIGGMVFHVRSDDPRRARKEDGKGFYVVDLTSYRGNGKCDCRNFRIELERDVFNGKNGLACKHIERTFAYVGRLTTQNFIKTYGKTHDT
jgi:hypothetical protein